MLIGVPKEIKTREFRVGLVPSSVAELVRRGHEVLIETQAGAGIGTNDDEYKAVGATIAAECRGCVCQSRYDRQGQRTHSQANGCNCHLIRFYSPICIWPLMHHKPMVLQTQDAPRSLMKPSPMTLVDYRYWHQ